MFVLFAHVGPSVAKKYLGPGDQAAYLNFGSAPLGTYSAYARSTSLRAVLQSRGWRGGPVGLVCWSAGCGVAREWMQDPDARSLVDKALLLDGLHTPGPPCQESLLAGLKAFALTGKPLIVSSTQITPSNYASSRDCARLLCAAGARVLESSGRTTRAHVEQVQTVGPSLWRGREAGTRVCDSGPRLDIVAGIVAVFALGAYFIVRK